MKIQQLINPTEEQLNEIATIWYNEWTRDEDKWSFEETIEYTKNLCQKDKIPFVFIAEENNEIIAAVGVSMSDLNVRPDIYPNIVNLYVKENYRGSRISEKLLAAVENKLKELNYKKIYLYTKHVGLYEKYNWTFLEKIDTIGLEPRIQNLYYKELD